MSQFNFEIAFCAGKNNERADALTRREHEVKTQATLMKEACQQTMLHHKNISPDVLRDLQLTPILADSLTLLDHVLQANRNHPDLAPLRQIDMNDSSSPWTLDNGLLFHHSKLMVPDTTWNNMPIRTLLIQEAHAQSSTAHPGRTKMTQLLADQYYWPKLGKHVAQYVRNCHDCRRSHMPHDKTPGLLNPLAVPDHPWQHITIDFKEFPPSKNGFNMIVVFIDRLGKRPISVPCFKTVTAADLAKIFISHVRRV